MENYDKSTESDLVGLGRIRPDSVFFVLVLALAVLTLGVASGQTMSRGINPSQVQTLIGVKIPDEPNYASLGWRAGSISDVIPEWSCLGGERSGEFIVDPCYHRDGIAAIVTMHHASRSPDSSMVVDALVLPFEVVLPPFDVRQQFGWDAKMRRDRQRQYAYSSCSTQKKRDGKPIVVALVRPESGKKTCGHFTRRIKQVWQLDKQTQRLEPISSENVFCWWNACLLEKICKNEDQCNML